MSTALNKNFTYYELGQSSFGIDGLEVKGAVVSRQVRGTIQSMSGTEAVPYLNGSRNTGMLKIYSSEQLGYRKQDGSGVGYVRNAIGDLFELVDEIPFQNLTKISHWKYIASRVPANQIPEALR